MYLKTYHRTEFFAALLSMESNSDKIDLYSKTARDYEINIKTPDINLSDYDFKAVDGDILYGFKSIKGIGDGPIEEVIKNRPYSSLENVFEKVPKKFFNKKVGTGLIKAGAMDTFNKNRLDLLNEFMDIRKDKDDRYIPDGWNKDICMEFEREVLSTSLTYVPWFDNLFDGESFKQTFDLLACTEKPDKKGNLMGFAKLGIQGLTIDALIFSKIYVKNLRAFDKRFTNTVTIKGKKDGNKILVSGVVRTTGEISNIQIGADTHW